MEERSCCQGVPCLVVLSLAILSLCSSILNKAPFSLLSRQAGVNRHAAGCLCCLGLLVLSLLQEARGEQTIPTAFSDIRSLTWQQPYPSWIVFVSEQTSAQAIISLSWALILKSLERHMDTLKSLGWHKRLGFSIWVDNMGLSWLTRDCQVVYNLP